MKQLWFLTVFAVILAFAVNVGAEEEIADKEVDTSAFLVEPSELLDLDAHVQDDGHSVRKPRQFLIPGLGRPPFFGGGLYRPRPFYGGGFYQPSPLYGGGFYGPSPFYGGGFYG